MYFESINSGRKTYISEPPRDDLSLPFATTHDGASWERSDIWMIAIDENLEPVWNKRLGGLRSDRPMDVVAAPDGGLLVCGVTDSPVSSEVTQEPLGLADVWIIKTDDRGLPEWDRRFGGAGRDTVHQVIDLENGHYLLVCSSNSLPGIGKAAPRIGGHDAWLVEMDGQGNRVREWTFGGTGDERHPRLVRRHEGGWLLACWSKSGVGGNRTVPRKGTDDIWVTALDDNFNPVWDQCYGGDRFEMLADMKPTPDGGYVLLSMSTSDRSFDKSEDHRPGSRTGDFWLLKIGPSEALALNELRFELQNLERSVALNWSRSDERDVLAYGVERSADLKRWTLLDSVSLAMTGVRGAGEHRYLDRNPLPERSYYRLRIEEAGGRRQYSNILEVTRPGGRGGVSVDLQVYPVPFSERLTLSYDWEAAHRIRVRTLTGSPAFEAELPAGQSIYRLDTSDWAAGVYLVEIWQGLRRVDVRRVLKI